jgi:hypothetical protein
LASPEPVRVQRRVSGTGVVMVARQTVALGRVHAGKTVTIDVTDTDLVVACDDGPRTIRRTTTRPIRNLKANRPPTTNPDSGTDAVSAVATSGYLPQQPNPEQRNEGEH